MLFMAPLGRAACLAHEVRDQGANLVSAWQFPEGTYPSNHDPGSSCPPHSQRGQNSTDSTAALTCMPGCSPSASSTRAAIRLDLAAITSSRGSRPLLVQSRPPLTH